MADKHVRHACCLYLTLELRNLPARPRLCTLSSAVYCTSTLEYSETFKLFLAQKHSTHAQRSPGIHRR
jgi:hypothetical protein